MNDGAAFMTDHLIGDTPVRQWVLSLPRPLRYILAYDSTVLGEVVNAHIGAIFQYLCWKAKEHCGLRSVSQAHPGSVTVIQRASSDGSLNVHLHSLVTDGIFIQEDAAGPVVFAALPPPSDADILDVASEICRRTRAVLVRHGLWKEDPADTPDDTVPDALADLYGASIRGVLLMGPRRGQRVVRFFAEAAVRTGEDQNRKPVGDAFNLHAGQAVHAGDRAAVERLARYILRPPLGSTRLELRADGQIAVTLKRPWRDGTTGAAFRPTGVPRALGGSRSTAPNERDSVSRRLRFPFQTSPAGRSASPHSRGS